jgi:F-box domain
MPSIPVDVLREILKHVGKKDLATLCRVNKICCSCSQDVLYREIQTDSRRLIRTLAQSTDLARRVRSFGATCKCQELAAALRNMPSLRSLYLHSNVGDAPTLDGCTFKLDSFICSIPYSESLHQFLICQPSLTNVTIWKEEEPLHPFDERCLPNLTRVKGWPSLLSILIPGRPVTDVVMITPMDGITFDLNLFALSTAPIHSLSISCAAIYPTPVSLLVSIFPSLANLSLDTFLMNWSVRRQLTVIVYS